MVGAVTSANRQVAPNQAIEHRSPSTRRPREEDVNWLGLVISFTQMFRSFFEGQPQGNSRDVNPLARSKPSTNDTIVLNIDG
ncbi:hypothetical protein L195_g016686 [Trifolium pratense]|uniref:Uncharacterized protein n=1 Tax=Trifolium pratense TaxID=57577 RepID=A0A2K3MS03_TRIPR|nr:hypothetical protein L195_g016686 [Trifolium pratense]